MITACTKCGAQITFAVADKAPELCAKCLHAEMTTPPVVSVGMATKRAPSGQMNAEGVVPEIQVKKRAKKYPIVEE